MMSMRTEAIDVALGNKKADLVIKNADLVNVYTGEIYRSDIAVAGNMIAGLGSYSGKREIDAKGKYAVPGLIDGHTHIEMSMMSVSEFARSIVPGGTTTVIEDPHEIANVLGVRGVKLILKEAKSTPLKVFCMAPSCVPSTNMETAGAAIGPEEIKDLLELEDVIGLAEMMNFPGVIYKDRDVLKKLDAARLCPIDGHAPGLIGKELNAYAQFAGSDHESTSYEEALEKLRLGMRVMIREGSAARNMKSLIGVAEKDCRNCILVTDGDRTPTDLTEQGYLDWVLRRAIEEGTDPVKAVQMCTINTAQWFRLWNLGAISPGKTADIVLLNNLEKFKVYKVIVDGKVLEEHHYSRFKYPKYARQTVKLKSKTSQKDFDIKLEKGKKRVIGVIDGEILTDELVEDVDGIDIKRDILGITVVERHGKTGNMGMGLVKGFGIKEGAIASSVAHDSHNIIVVGTNGRDMARSVNTISRMGGGLTACNSEDIASLGLPIAGLMSDKGLDYIRDRSVRLNELAKKMGCKLRAPFLTLSFMSLPVIPKLKITDKGLVDVEKFDFVDLVVS